jgi:hypothetical protein
VLLAARPPSACDRFACYLITDESRVSDVARTVECSVFKQFFHNTAEFMSDSYAPYEAHSRFLLVVDTEAQLPAGTIRIIRHSESGFKTLNDVERSCLAVSAGAATQHHGIADLDSCWDVGTLAVLKGYRGRSTDHFVSTLLYGRLHSEARSLGIRHLVTVLDRHAFSQLTQMFAIPFEPLAGSAAFPYLGSESSRAVYGYLPSFVPSMNAYLDTLHDAARQVLKPYMMRLMFGSGLPEVTHLP